MYSVEEVDEVTCSRLYPLEPIGLHTCYVESLTSYIIRLAAEHLVTPQNLIRDEIAPLFIRTPSKSALWQIWYVNANTVNSLTPMAEEWVNITEHLTGREDLRQLTALNWRSICTAQGLVRLFKAWCPNCLSDWQAEGSELYEPLLWTFRSVEACSLHRCLLATACTYCHKNIPFIKQQARIGYCSFCQNWLGLREVTSSTPMSTPSERQIWATQMMGETLVYLNRSSGVPEGRLPQILENYAQKVDDNYRALAGLMQTPHRTLWNLRKLGVLPEVERLLHICTALKISLKDFLADDATMFYPSRQQVLSKIPLIKLRKGYSNAEHVPLIREALQFIVDHPVVPPLSIEEITKHMGFTRKPLKRHCPDLFQAIVQAYYHVNRKSSSQEVVAIRHREPKKLLAIDEQLQEFLNDDTQLISLREASLRLGSSVKTLKYHFPELCVEIVKRRKGARRSQHQQNTDKLVCAVRAKVYELHRQGVYPSSNKVANLLGVNHIFRQEKVHQAWEDLLVSLGYREKALEL